MLILYNVLHPEHFGFSRSFMDAEIMEAHYYGGKDQVYLDGW